MTNNAERLGLKIKELRISKGYTQAGLAKHNDEDPFIVRVVARK